LPRSVKYGLGVLATSAQYRLQKLGWRHYPYLEFDHAAVLVRLPSVTKDAAEWLADTSESA
jgi:hypothetical protein